MTSSLQFERKWPIAFGFIVSVLFYILLPQYKAPDTAKDLLTAAISIGAIAVGFLATMKAVLFTIDKKTIIAQLKESSLYGCIVDYLLSGIKWWSMLSIFSAFELVADLQSHPKIYHVLAAAWVFIAFAAIGAYWRVVQVFTRILRAD